MAMERVRAGWRCFSRSFSDEARVAFRSPVIHWLGWCFPLLLFILISSNFSEGTMLELPVSVVDNDQSPLSRQLIRNLDAGSHAQISAYEGGLPEALKRLRSAKDYALLYVPVDFEKNVLAGKQPSVVMYYNALFYGAGLYSTQDFTGLIAELNSHYRTIIASVIGKEVPPLASVTLNYGSLFNASGSFIYYQQFAATIHLLQLFTVTCMIYVLDRRKALMQARPFGLAVIGKLAPYTLGYTTLLMAEIALLVFVFDARVSGNPLFMLMIGFFYVIAAQSIGIMLFTFTKTAITAYTLIGMLVSIALTYSGLAVPELSMPLPAQIISNIEPLTHALYAMFDVFLRQVPASAIFSVCALLMVYPLITWLLVRKRLLKRYRLEEEQG
ncbi:ABC transporter permease [Enterobacillus tribolii]|uniref:ABC-2 type transport system permease protein n=1 Tax=Enterobacillus tribolii TaxID=1487935 RepID=A0A370R173_9GAMM|nr:ABC transporter permease [Enterobacillus tribolii]MBW7982765.1 ABC transporter permease [Enterobacillus tribolii]RDK95673.1 ABC-2 type transport system permease protein [Enterobacillus tribolii]